MDMAVMRRVFAALDARIDLVPRWRGGELDRLLDAKHARMIETLVRRVSQLPEWIVHPEVTFSIYGERGAIDIVAWHPGRRALLIIEAKSEIGDTSAGSSARSTATGGWRVSSRRSEAGSPRRSLSGS